MEQGKMEENFIESTYCKALTGSLTELAEEDCLHHGRLLVMKEQTSCLTEANELSDKQLMMFYIKDIMHQRVKDTQKELTYA